MRISESVHMGMVLVVDDDPDAREAVSRYLARSGYAVRSATNGREALIAIATTVPDAIVLDVRMPEMDGIEFLQVIRSYLRWQTVPVILLTAYDHGEDLIARAHELGVKMIYKKSSYRLDDLLQCIHLLVAAPGARFEGNAGGGGA